MSTITIRVDSSTMVQLHRTEQISDTDWDQFLEGLPQSHHEQTSRWAAVERESGWLSERVAIHRGGSLAGGCQLLYREVRWGKRIGYARKGPVFLEDDPGDRREIVRRLVEESHRLDLVCLVVDPPWPDAHLTYAFDRAGFAIKPPEFPPSALPTATLILDLSLGLDDLRMTMRRETRREIRIGRESGLTFHEGTEMDLPAFFELMKTTALRQGADPIPGNLAKLKRLWAEFRPKGWIRLFVVRSAEQIVSAALIFPFGPMVRFWKYGWSGDHARKRPNQFLYWNLVRWSKEAGYRHFDIVQVEPTIGRLLSKGEPVPDTLRQHRLYGPTLFKMGFGGRVVELPGARYRFRNRTLHRLLVVSLPTLGRIGRVRRWMNSIS